MSKSIEVIARGLMWRDGRILVCVNTEGGYCYLPGGHVEFGEAAADALVREVKEEAGVEVACGELALATEVVFVARGKQRHELNLVFHVQHALGDHVSSQETDISFKWVEVAALPDVDLRPASIKAWILASDGLRWISDVAAKEKY